MSGDRRRPGCDAGSGMALRLVALCVDANDPLGLARFWAEAIRLVPTDGTRFRMDFMPVPEPKVGPNRLHLDLTSTSLDDQRDSVARLVELGARHIDIGQRPEEGHVVLADPEGNEFCVIEPGNNFLADCGFIGALACN